MHKSTEKRLGFVTGLCVATLGIALVVRIIVTFLMVCFAGFNFKEKVFISLAWIPKATVQVISPTSLSFPPKSVVLGTAENRERSRLGNSRMQGTDSSGSKAP